MAAFSPCPWRRRVNRPRSFRRFRLPEPDRTGVLDHRARHRLPDAVDSEVRQRGDADRVETRPVRGDVGSLVQLFEDPMQAAPRDRAARKRERGPLPRRRPDRPRGTTGGIRGRFVLVMVRSVDLGLVATDRGSITGAAGRRRGLGPQGGEAGKAPDGPQRTAKRTGGEGRERGGGRRAPAALSRAVFAVLAAARRAVEQQPRTLPDLRRWVVDAGGFAAQSVAAAAVLGDVGTLAAEVKSLIEAEPDLFGPPVLDGDEIMALLGLNPGPAVGAAVEELRRHRLDSGPLTPEEARGHLLEWQRLKTSEHPQGFRT